MKKRHASHQACDELCFAPDESPAESKLQCQCKSKPSLLYILIMLGRALQ